MSQVFVGLKTYREQLFREYRDTGLSLIRHPYIQ